MKEKITSKWRNIDEIECLLFFAQTVEELLFYYTIDSYRLPAHNLHSLLDEALKTIDHVKNNILKEGTISPIIEEIDDQLERDIIYKEIFGPSNSELRQQLKRSRSIEHKLDLISYINKRIEKKYLSKIIEVIRIKISENERKDLIYLTKLLLIEINKYKYFSREYIYDKCMKVFFKSKVEDISSYDKFIDQFRIEYSDFEVLFQIGDGFLQVKKRFNRSMVTIHENIDSKDQKFKTWGSHSFFEDGKSYISLTVNAKDEYKAYFKARYELIGIASHISFLKHSDKLNISEVGLVKFSTDKKVVQCSEITSPIHRRPDVIKDAAFQSFFRAIVKNETNKKIDDNTLQRLNLAFQRHAVSLKSSSYENQLVDLWSGIECLIPVYKKDSDDKIVQIIGYLSPMLVYNYIGKLLKDIDDSLRFCKNYRNIKIYLKEKNIDSLKSLAQLILLKSNQELQELYELIHPNILLIDRIKYLKNIFKNPDHVKKRLISHETRLKWQIQRIYRARNLIIHSGKTPYQLETLIENMHYYFDTVMRICIICLSQNDEYNCINDVISHYMIKKNTYYSYLDRIKKEEINDENIEAILSISEI